MMHKRVTLREALEAWGADSTTGITDQDGHIPLATLYEFLIQPPEPHRRDAILDHLTCCPVCLGEFKQMATSIEDADHWAFGTREAASLRAAAPVGITDALPSHPTAVGVEDIDRWAFETHDIAYLRAAAPETSADAFESPQRITTDGGKYIIDIRRYLGKENLGLITLRVAEPYRASLEGKTVYVTDAAGRLLLQGPIHDGEISKELIDLGQIAKQLFVRAE